MRARIRGIFAAGRRLTAVVAFAIAAAVMLRPSTANAAVEYVKICNAYAGAFFYLPGTDTCLDLATEDARQASAGYDVSDLPACPSPNTFVSDATDSSCTSGTAPVGGGGTACDVACVGGAWQFTGKAGVTWHWRIPNNPRQWVPTPQVDCQGGQLIKFGDLTGSSLTQNSNLRYETTKHYQLNLKPGQYVASVLYQGGFSSANHLVSNLHACPSSNTFVTDATDDACTAGDDPVGGGHTGCDVTCVAGAWEFTGTPAGSVGAGNFCMFYYYNDPTTGSVYTPLGCIDTGAQAGQLETLAFSPDSPIPPATLDQVYVLGANGDLWNVLSTSDIGGMLSVWLCLQTAPGVGPS